MGWWCSSRVGGEHGDRHVIVKHMGEGDTELDIEQIIEENGGNDGKNVFVIKRSETIDVTDNGDGKVFVKRMHGGDMDGHAYAFSDGEMPGDEMWVNIASEMMGKVDTEGMDRKTRKKVEAAQKALEEAQQALEKAQ